MKIIDLLLHQRMNNKPAISEDNDMCSYAELYGKCVQCASFLKSCVSQRCHVGILLPNSIKYVVAYFSVLMLNDVVVPIYYQSTCDEIESIIRECDIGLFITDSKRLTQVANIKFSHHLKLLDIDSFCMYDKGDPNKQPQIASPQEVSVMLGTSGSTGHSKRVMLTDENILNNAEGIIHSLEYTCCEKFLVVLPLTFASGNTSQLIVSFLLGATLYIYNRPIHPKMFFCAIKQYEITTTTIVPSILKVLLSDYNEIYCAQALSLRVICFGGGPTDVVTQDRIAHSYLRHKLVHMYGQTEASTRISHLHLSRDGDKFPSVGKPLRGIQVAVSNKGEDDQSGEIIVKGKNIMLGYYKDTKPATLDGWLATGDMGYIDDDGYIYITGRKKNIIIYSGMNIQAEEVEDVLVQHPGVINATVFGEYDAYHGEIPVAEVVLTDGYTITERELRDFCSTKLSNYKIPAKIFFVNALEQTYNGKKLRRRGKHNDK